MGGRGGGNEGWKRDFGAKVIFFGERRVHMVFRRMKGGSVVTYRVQKENNRKLIVNEWGSLEYYTTPPPSPYPPLCQAINDK